MIRNRLAAAAAVCAGLAILPLAAPAQQYPARPVTIIVPFAPGGPADALARLVAKGMSENLGQNVIIELKPGAGGNIGAEYVARQSRPDGYTLLLATPSLATNVSLTKLSFDPRTDLAPVAGLRAIPNALVVAADSPYKTVADIVEAARKDANALTFGSSGPGTGSHLAGELFKSIARVNITHVPYRGSGAVYPDIIAGRVTMVFEVFGSALGQIKGGKVRALAITAQKRSPALPGTPTFAEAGYPNYQTVNWSALMTRAGTPQEPIARLAQSVQHALATPEMVEWQRQLGAEPLPLAPAEFGRYFNAEVERWSRMVAEGKIKPAQ